MAGKVKKPVNMDPRFVEGCVVTLDNTEIRYSHMINPDTEYNEEWSVHCKIEDASAQIMKDLGFNIRTDSGDNTHWLKVKRVVTTRNGNRQSPPIIEDAEGEKITEEPGAGSIGNIHLWCKYTAPIQGKIYMGAYLNGATLTDIKKKAQQTGVVFNAV